MLIVQLVSSVVVLITSYWLGVKTGLFLFHVTFPLGFWLLFDGLDYLMTGKSLLRGPKRFLFKCLGFSALLGLIMDYEMVRVARILCLQSVDTIGEVFLLYVGWGFCLPAIYESYRVFSHLIRKGSGSKPYQGKLKEGIPRIVSWLGWMGLLFIAISRFQIMYLNQREGSILLIFFGMWFVLEWWQGRNGRTGLLGYTLAGNIVPFSAIFLGAFVLTLSWESMNFLMTSWFYQDIFWLNVRIANIPLIVFFGYGFWYILFLSLFSIVSEENIWDS